MKKYIFYLKDELKYWLLLRIVFAIFIGLLPFFNIYLTKYLVNNLQKIINGNSFLHEKTLLILVLIIVLGIIQMLISNYTGYIDNKYEAKLNYKFERIIIEKSINVPYSYFENTVFQNHLNRISYDIGNRFMMPIKSSLNVVSTVISFFSIFAYIFTVSKLSSFIFLLLLPIIFINMRFGKKRFNLSVYQTPKAREMSYLNNILTERNSALEIRLFNLGVYFKNRWSRLYWSVNNEVIKLNKLVTINNSFLSILMTSIFSVILIQSLYLVFLKRNTLGGFVAIFQSLSSVQSSLFSLSTEIALVYTEILYIKDFFDFLDFEDENIKGDYQSETSLKSKKNDSEDVLIEFNSVDFNYPYSKQKVLKNITFTISAGEKVAIVGENGSGKTTLTKCLMKLVSVDNGDIYFNNQNIKTIDNKTLLNEISVIPQNFMKYNLSFKDNIILNKKYDENEFLYIMKTTGLDRIAKKLPNRYETFLGKEFIEGEDLSGGQWQAIAIARAKYRNSSIFIMDEPTSSLDFKAEENFYKELVETSEDKTVIFISHRTSFTKLADKIIVLKDGSINEIGTHDNLMSNRGEYYEMYTTQSKRYV